MPLFKSLRSKSRKSSFSSEAGLKMNQSPNGGTKAGRFGRSEDDAASVIAGQATNPTSPRQAKSGGDLGRSFVSSPIQEHVAPGGDTTAITSPTLSPSAVDAKKKSGGGFFGRSNSKRDLASTPLPQRTLSYGQSGNDLAAQANHPAGSETTPQLSASSNALAEAAAEAANQPPGGARPSDLFAGKGLAWGDLDLSSGGATVAKAPQQTDELSNFLKARRQWVPTFVTQEKEEVDVKQVSNPDDIAFSTLPSAGSLMSLSELDASHKRKQQLLGGNFETTTLLAATDKSTTALPIATGLAPKSFPAGSQLAPADTTPPKNLTGSTPLTAVGSNQSKTSPTRKAVPTSIIPPTAQSSDVPPSAVSSARVPTSNGEATNGVSKAENPVEVQSDGTAESHPQKSPDASPALMEELPPTHPVTTSATTSDTNIHHADGDRSETHTDHPVQKTDSTSAGVFQTPSASVPVSETGHGAVAPLQQSDSDAVLPEVDGKASAARHHADEEAALPANEGAVPVHPSYNKADATATATQGIGNVN